MAPMLSISVVISTHTEARWGFVQEAVESIRRQTHPAIETIVVIDHNPSLLQRVRASMTDVIAIENTEAKGASGSKNSGARAASGAIIAFLDDDAVAEPEWLAELAGGFTSPHVLGVGGLTLPRWAGEKPGWFPEEFYWVLGCTHKGAPETTAPVRNLIACNMAVRREIFSDDAFRTDMGPQGRHALGCEETEFCIRVSQRRRGGIWLHKPSARVYHQVPVSRATWWYLLRRCGGEGRSKALVTKFTGARVGLASERTYVLRTLPRGVLRGVHDALLGRDKHGLGRAAAIVAGFSATATSYVSSSFLSFLGPLLHVTSALDLIGRNKP